MADSGVSRVCLCLLPPADEVLGWVPAFADDLRRRGIQLVVLRMDAIGCPIVHLPGSTPVAPQLPNVSAQRSSVDEALVRRVIESGFGPGDEEGAREVLARSAAAAELFCETLAPEMVLLWSDTNPRSRALRAAFDRRRVPAWFVERGFFPDTLMLEMNGHGGLSELRTSFALAHLAASPAADMPAYEALRDYMISRATPKYPQGARAARAALRQTYAPGGGPLVLFLGQWDPSAGVSPASSPERLRHSPGYASTDAAFEAVATACRSIDGCRLVFRPHPVATARGRVPADAIVMEDVHLHSAIDAADVVVGQLSTSMFDAVLLDKPVVSLGRGVLAERGITYDCTSGSDLEHALRAAIDRVDFSARRQRAAAFLTWVARHFLIGTSREVPIARPLEDLAAFVETSALPADGRSFEDRWKSVV